MLKVPAPFPQVGSYGLLVDLNQPPPQSAELVRIMRRDDFRGQVSVAFPLRAGACGNRIVAASELIDATPLTKAEERELTDLQRHLVGRTRMTPKLRAMNTRAHDLKARQIFGIILERELGKLNEREARDLRRAGGSTGQQIKDAA